MEVNSVAFVVIQKLKDMLTFEESIIGQAAIVDQLNEIKDGLEKLRKFFIDEEDKTGEVAVQWAAEYLQNLYYVEDTIETFALRIYLRNKRSFLLKHALFIKNFTAYKKLKRKIAKIKKEIIDLQDKKLVDLEEASVRASTRRSDDIDKQSSADEKLQDLEKPSVRASTRRSDDIDKQSSAEENLEDLEKSSVRASKHSRSDDIDKQSSGDEKLEDPEKAIVCASTRRSDDIDKQSSGDEKLEELEKASVRASPRRIDDIDKQSSGVEKLEDLEKGSLRASTHRKQSSGYEKLEDPEKASVRASTGKSDDIDKQSSADGNLEDLEKASVRVATRRSDDIDKQSFGDEKLEDLEKASVRASPRRSDDIDKQSSADEKLDELEKASVCASTCRSDDIDKQSFGDENLEDLKKGSLRASTQRSDDIDKPGSADEKLEDFEKASVRASTHRSDDIDKQSSADENNDTDRVAESMMNVPARTTTRRQKTLSSPRSDISLMVRFQGYHKPVSRSPSEISYDRTLHEHHHKPVRLNSQISADRSLNCKLNGNYSYKAEELGLVGFGKYIHDLEEQLTGGDNQIIPVVGRKGSGKTTLARAIRAHKGMKDEFKHSLAWVTIDKESSAKGILLNLLKQVGSSKDQDLIDPGTNLVSLIKKLNDILKGKRFLIVLDDLRESVTWEKIQDAFLDNRNGNKIIITTRHQEVAESANMRYSLVLERLTDVDALDLFQQKAGLECPENLEQKILKICDGLPINVVLLGSLLSMKDHANWGTELNRDLQSGILAWSFNDISPEEKLCLLYMALFPKEYDIPVRRLLRLWLAEGFIERPTENHIFPEDRVEECFNRLLQRSLILITNQRSDGGHRKCQLQGALHGYLLSKAIDIKLFHVHTNKKCLTEEPSLGGSNEKEKEKYTEASLGARRLVEFVDSKNCEFYLSCKLNSKLKSWRSYLSFNFQKKDTPAREVGVLLSNMLKSGLSLLRVLDLEGVYKPSLPDNLGNFVQLRYLGLRWTFLDHLPSSVGDLTYLETLDLKHTNVNSLPASVWKLNHLRHLNLNDIRVDIPVTSNHSLPRILTLCGLSIVEGEVQVKNGLDRLVHLRELDLTFQLQSCEELLDWVSKSTSLEQLRLRSKNDQGRPSTLCLKSLAGLTKLSHMNFLGRLPKLLEQKEFPQNLKVLTISV